MIGKMHHCMVDGAAVVELGKLILDAEPDAGQRADEASGRPCPSPRRARGWPAPSPTAPPTAPRWLAPVRIAGSPSRLRALPGLATRGARTLSQTLLPPAPARP